MLCKQEMCCHSFDNVFVQLEGIKEEFGKKIIDIYEPDEKFKSSGKLSLDGKSLFT